MQYTRHSSNSKALFFTPENVFLAADGTAKIGDFGLVHALHKGSEIKGVEGTYLYMAPEVIAKKPYNSKADIFSLGLVFWELATGELLTVPFRHSSSSLLIDWDLFQERPSLYSSRSTSPSKSSTLLTSVAPPPARGVPLGDEALKDSAYNAEVRCSGVSDESLRHLIASMLAKEPERRPTAEEVVTHPALLGNHAQDKVRLRSIRACIYTLVFPRMHSKRQRVPRHPWPY